jgi:hypothetical protein
MDTSDLANWFTGAEYTSVETKDGNRVIQPASSEQYSVFLFKDIYSGQVPFTVECNLQSSLAPSLSTVFLQIYNRVSMTWETLDSESLENADTDFTLTGEKSTNLADYFDAGFEISCRVYQQIS